MIVSSEVLLDTKKKNEESFKIKTETIDFKVILRRKTPKERQPKIKLNLPKYFRTEVTKVYKIF